MSGHKYIKIISGENCLVFEREVNKYFRFLEEHGWPYTVSCYVMPWSIDGNSGSSHFAHISYEN